MPIIGKPLEGRQYKTDGSNSNQKPIEIEASIGDGATAGSATPFLKLTGTSASTTDGDNNVTTADYCSIRIYKSSLNSQFKNGTNLYPEDPNDVAELNVLIAIEYAQDALQ